MEPHADVANRRVYLHRVIVYSGANPDALLRVQVLGRRAGLNSPPEHLAEGGDERGVPT